MDFFSHQEQARRNTTKLVVLFCLAVVALIFAIYAVCTTVFVATGLEATEQRGFWQPDVLLFSVLGTLLIVSCGSLYKIQQLRAGGEVVARMLGGRRLQPNTDDHKEKVLLNVVEEMSIASGVPVPAVFVLDREAGINAFAAGFAPSDAVIGVTRGTLDQLSRDQLQGVIAHEFSHVLNGDMRLNIRLMGVLHGILCIALAGYVILRSGAGFRSRGGKNSAAGGILVLAIALLAIGYLGMFFAKLIQAAVSRQREFLADASAVQFTRNPDGLTAVLKKLGGFAEGSRLQTAQAAATSHMFFGNALAPSLFNALSTHPPLEERIRRIDRAFRAEEAAAGSVSRKGVAVAGAAGFAGAGAAGFPSDPMSPIGSPTPARLVGQTGRPTDQHLAHTQEMLRALPLNVSVALHEPFSARALIYALLLDRNAKRRRQQIGRLEGSTDAPTLQEATQLATELKGLDAAMFLPLVDLAMPALREMSQSQFRQFSRDVQTLIEADDKVTLFEFTLQKVLLRHLATEFVKPPLTRIRFRSLKPLLNDAQVLLSSLAHVGHDDPRAIQEAYVTGITILPGDGYERRLLDLAACSFRALDHALDRLSQSTPGCKQFLLRACAETIAHDGEVHPAEAELFRAIADTLDCPMPPILVAPKYGV